MDLVLFKTITSAAFHGHVQWFGNRIAEIKERLEESVGYAVSLCYENGDATALNKLVAVLEPCGLEPKFRRCVAPFVPFSYDKAEFCFTGKIQKGKRETMSKLDENNAPIWESGIMALLNGEKPENKDAPSWKLDTRMPSLIKKAIKEGYTLPQIRAEFEKDVKELTVEVPTVADAAANG